MSAAKRASVFIDRDDTLMACRSLPVRAGVTPGDVTDPGQVSLLPGVHEACRALREAGFVLVVFTNQGAVARGGCGVDDVARVNERLCELLRDGSAPGASLIDAVYFCPFHPKGSVPEFTREHPWRKPAPGMILAAADDHGLDLARSWVIGDQPRDIDAGRAAGIADDRLLLIGEGGRARDFAHAAEILLGRGLNH